MWTEKNRKYYTLLRAQDKVRDVKSGGSRTNGAATDRNSTTTGVAGSARQSGTNARQGRHATALPDATFIDPSEGHERVLDPVRVMDLAPTEIPKTTALTLAHRGLTDLHPNFLLFSSLESLALQSNQLTRVRNLLPAPTLPAYSASTSLSAAGRHTARATGTAGGAVSDAVGGAPDGPRTAATTVAASTAASSSTTNAPKATATTKSSSTRSSRMLDHLTGSKGCTRLLRLYLSDNAITSLLDSDIPRLTSLQQLFLANNKISDLDGTLRALRRLHTLTCLDLSGNPITEEPGYRERILRTLPQLEVLDRLSVPSEERAAALVAISAGNRMLTTNSNNNNGGSSRLHGQSTGTIGGAADDGANSTIAPAGVVAARSVHFEMPAMQPGKSNAGGSMGAAAKPTVAFGSSYTPSPPPPPAVTSSSTTAAADTKGKKRAPWPMSATVQQLEVRRARYLDQQAHEQRTQEAARAAELAAVEEERLAFHAVWGLSGQNMPLSEQRYHQWSALAGNGTSSFGEASTSVSSPIVAAATPKRSGGGGSGGLAQARRRSSGNHRGSQGTAGGSSASASAVGNGGGAENGADLMGPETMKRLLPTLPTRPEGIHNGERGTANPNASRTDTAVMHESRLYDALLGRQEAVKSKSSQQHTGWTAQALPPADRLQTMRTAVAASKELLQHHVGGLAPQAAGSVDAPTASSSQRGTPMSSRPSSASGADSPLVVKAGPVDGASTVSGQNDALMALVAAEENAEAARLLMRIQKAKVAMVPRPWENAPAKAGFTLMASDLQQQALKLLHTFFLPQELRMLESQYNGLCEVLLVLRSTGNDLTGTAAANTGGAQGSAGGVMNAEASATSATASAAASGGGVKAARSVSEGTGSKRKAGGGGRGNAVNLVTASDALLSDGALLRLMTSPLIVTLAPMTSGGRRSASGPSNGNFSLATHGRLNSVVSAGSAHLAAPPVSLANGSPSAAGVSFVSMMSGASSIAPGAAGGGGAALPAGAVGPYVDESVESLLSTLAHETGAWELDVEGILAALGALHHVDLTTSEPLPSADEEAAAAAITGQASGPVPSSSSPAVDATTPGTMAEDGQASRAGAGAESRKKASLRSGAVTTKTHKKNATAASTTKRMGSLSTASAAGQSMVADGGAYPRGSVGALRRRVAYLTVNNALLALVYYLPFVAARVRFFQQQSREGVEANLQAQHVRTSGVGGVAGGAAEWFRRAQQAELHQGALRAQLETLHRASSADPPLSFDAFAERTMVRPEQLGTREVQQVGGFFGGGRGDAVGSTAQ